MSNLLKRTISALILAPLFIYILYIGGYAFIALTIVMFLVMYYEWLSITSKAKNRLYWAVFGLMYLGLAMLTFNFLEKLRLYESVWGIHKPPFELFIILSLVWISDIFGYFFGRAIGGPRLAPKISPNKTWAGSIGGILGGVLFYFILNFATDFGAGHISDKNFYIGLFLYILVPIITQIGDLFESYMKRRFGVKDSGNIIPGHGGLLDRMDGLLLVLNVVGIYIFISTYNIVIDRIGL